jgi:DNA polymerase-3 subunit delta'
VLPEISERGIPSIKIEQIRRLQQDLSLSAYEGRYKIALLKQFDAANANAANAFLKTLEEPPGHVILILTAADSESILPTIASRCQTVALRPTPAVLIEEALMTRWRARTEDANLLAHLADGRLGWAVEALQDRARLETRADHLDLLYRALQGNLIARFSLAETLARKAETLPDMLQTWLSWWRDLVLLAFDRRAQDRVANIDQSARLITCAGNWPPRRILDGLSQTERGLRLLRQNANTRLVLENLMLTYPFDPASIQSE